MNTLPIATLVTPQLIEEGCLLDWPEPDTSDERFLRTLVGETWRYKSRYGLLFKAYIADDHAAEQLVLSIN